MGQISETTRQQGRCVILGGAPTNDSMLKLLHPDDFIVAADAGWQTARRWKRPVQLAVGDWDSAPRPQMNCQVIDLPVEKDDTDTHFAAQLAQEHGFAEVLILGGSGGRLDHTLANFSTLLYLAQAGIKAWMADQDFCAWALWQNQLEIKRTENSYLSVFPWGGPAFGVTLSGVKYPLQKAQLSQSFPLGVSNEILSDHAEIEVLRGGLLILCTHKT
ncbi:MAG: thiamine diphosphokinase [Pygmaiobacter massiliensis]|nr:thiamine diphosphokinase [Pygmaiobacter massiliensis]